MRTVCAWQAYSSCVLNTRAGRPLPLAGPCQVWGRGCAAALLTACGLPTAKLGVLRHILCLCLHLVFAYVTRACILCLHDLCCPHTSPSASASIKAEFKIPVHPHTRCALPLPRLHMPCIPLCAPSQVLSHCPCANVSHCPFAPTQVLSHCSCSHARLSPARSLAPSLQDTLYFLFLLLMLYVGFALAFYVLAPPSTAPGSLALKLFTIMVGDVSAVRGLAHCLHTHIHTCTRTRTRTRTHTCTRTRTHTRINKHKLHLLCQ